MKKKHKHSYRFNDHHLFFYCIYCLEIIPYEAIMKKYEEVLEKYEEK